MWTFIPGVTDKFEFSDGAVGNRKPGHAWLFQSQPTAASFLHKRTGTLCSQLWRHWPFALSFDVIGPSVCSDSELILEPLVLQLGQFCRRVLLRMQYIEKQENAILPFVFCKANPLFPCMNSPQTYDIHQLRCGLCGFSRQKLWC